MKTGNLFVLQINKQNFVNYPSCESVLLYIIYKNQSKHTIQLIIHLIKFIYNNNNN